MNQNQVENGRDFHYSGMKNYLKIVKCKRLFFYTVIVAVIATIISTLIGTFTSIGIYKLTKKTKAFVLNINYLPVISPDIVLAVALMMLFKTVRLEFGFTTMLLAHIMFCIPYVVLSVLPRLYAMNQIWLKQRWT